MKTNVSTHFLILCLIVISATYLIISCSKSSNPSGNSTSDMQAVSVGAAYV